MKIEKIKAVLIIVLSLSAVLLSYFNFIYDRSFLVPNDNISVQTRDYTQSPLLPVCITEGRSGARKGFCFNFAALAAVYDQFTPRLAEVFGSAEKADQITRSAWLAALANPGIYLDYGSVLPVGAISAQLGGTGGQNRAAATRLLFLDYSGDTVQLFAADPDGSVYLRADTAVPATASLNQLSRAGAYDCKFAFEADGLYEGLPEEQVITAEQLPAPVEMSVPSEPAMPVLSDLLPVFGLDRFTAQAYTSADGAVSFVAANDTLTLTKDGMLVYSAGTNGGISVSSLSAGDFDDDAAMTAASASLVSRAVASIQSGPSLYLRNYIKDENEIRVVFGYRVNCVPVGAGGLFNHCAIIIKNGMVVYAGIRLRSFAQTEISSAAIGMERAAAAISDGGFFAVYSLEKDGYLYPEWIIGGDEK